MTTFTATGEGFSMSVSDPPSDWYIADQVVPALHSPHELFAFSNRPLETVSLSSDQNRPMVSQLDSAAMLLWGYYEILGDPEIDDPSKPPIPDYGRYKLPLSYLESEAFPAQSAYDWNPADFIWRRIGVNLQPTSARPEPGALTLMVWEGTRSSVQDVNTTAAIIASLSIN